MTVQAIDQSYLISPTPQQPSQEKKTQRFRPQVMGGKIEDPGVYEKEVEVLLRHGPDFNRSPAFLKRGSVGAGRRGEKDFTGPFVPPRYLRLFRTAFLLIGSVPDPAAVGHSGRDS
jgi:hypothetical protein